MWRANSNPCSTDAQVGNGAAAGFSDYSQPTPRGKRTASSPDAASARLGLSRVRARHLSPTWHSACAEDAMPGEADAALRQDDGIELPRNQPPAACGSCGLARHCSRIDAHELTCCGACDSSCFNPSDSAAPAATVSYSDHAGLDDVDCVQLKDGEAIASATARGNDPGMVGDAGTSSACLHRGERLKAPSACALAVPEVALRIQVENDATCIGDSAGTGVGHGVTTSGWSEADGDDNDSACEAPDEGANISARWHLSCMEMVMHIPEALLYCLLACVLALGE